LTYLSVEFATIFHDKSYGVARWLIGQVSHKSARALHGAGAV
jgi:hypothetical protein